MPIFVQRDISERQALLVTPQRKSLNNEYVEGVRGMELGKTYELAPDEGMSLRGLKVNVRRAANILRDDKAINFVVQYGETVNGTLLVWPELETPKRVRGAKKNGTEASAEATASA